MKLLTRTTIYYLLFSLPLLMLCGWFLYYNIERALQHEVDEELQNSKVLWVQHLNNLAADRDILELNNPYVQIEKTSITSGSNFYSDTLVYEPLEKGKDPYRNLTVFIERNNQRYKLSFQRSVLEHGAVFKKLIVVMSYVFAGLLLLFLLINLYINKKLWKPFNTSLEKITSLNMQQLQQVHFDKVAIREFNALNTSLNAMTDKMQADYLSMKTFTQNASHEIQTPLAIIQSKLELLLQDSLLTEQQTTAIASAFDATQRLSKLNQSLLLLAKIENGQFKDEVPLNLNKLIEEKLDYFEEMIQFKNIRVEKNFTGSIQIKMDPLLSDILLSNIIGNAIRHNINGGLIRITTTGSSLIVSNIGNAPAMPAEKFFERFSKDSSSSESAGLGLAIVKQVCDTYNYTVEFSFSAGLHILTVHF